MKTGAIALLVSTLVVLVGLVHFANTRIQQLRRDITALQQENDELKRYCPPVIRRPMEGANGSN